MKFIVLYYFVIFSIFYLPLSSSAKDAKNIFGEIALSACSPSNGVEGRPLPLAALWNTGQAQGGFDPKYQIDLIRKGHHLLPTFHLPSPLHNSPHLDYYETAIKEARNFQLPIAFASTQWEHMLTDDKTIFNLPAAENPNVVNINGNIEENVSPFGPVELWKIVGRRWTDNNLLRKLQEWYPSPPLIIFLSNNEHKKLIGPEVEKSIRYNKKYGSGHSDIFKNKVISDGWIERFGSLFEGMVDGLSSSFWKDKSKFIGYNAFQYCGFGRGNGWLRWSLYSPGRLSPWPEVWDGASLSFYVRPYNDSTDYKLFSPQIEAMNWVFMIEDVHQKYPNFWIEISTWDGGNEQRLKYVKNGQRYSPERYSGMVQFGMWLLRPRIVREFRMWNETIENSGEYFERVVGAVDKVHDNAILQKFWRFGNLVSNTQRQHPYDKNIPIEYQSKDRWFLLESTENDIGNIEKNNKINLFSLAIVNGLAPSREWLIYTFSPLGNISQAHVLLPGYGKVVINSKIEGVFYHVKERSKETLEVK